MSLGMRRHIQRQNKQNNEEILLLNVSKYNMQLNKVFR